MRFMWLKLAVSRPWRISAKLLIISSVVTIIGFSAVCGSVMLDMRHGEEELARRSLESLASSIDYDISRTVELYDQSLRAVVTNIAKPEFSEVSKQIRQLILFDRAGTAKYFGPLQVFDAAGNVTIDASTLDPPTENRADEEYFRIHRDKPDLGLFISRPMLHHGAYSIVLSRRISGADGRFLGVVAGSIRFSYFHDLFGRLRLGPDDSITVLRRDGILIMRTPFDLDVIGRDFSHLPEIMQVMAEPSGSFSSSTAIDQIPRLYVWVDGMRPLVVIVGTPWSSVFSLWQEQARRIGTIMLTLIAFVICVTLFLAQEIRRRARAERSLEELATTDALTGLKNRRKFDAVIESEWRRAVRQGTPLALLLIDADYFKAFNDAFGHQPGDQALIAIAGCIEASVRRAGDCAARYGGEEFAVLLPGLSAEEAHIVAETIRGGVEQLPAAPICLTVSIGVASLTPTAAMMMNWSGLVEAADKALYAAKAAGRNQSVVANVAQLALVA
jgi:diguanylate cyclase (GGDEF)-like protein